MIINQDEVIVLVLLASIMIIVIYCFQLQIYFLQFRSNTRTVVQQQRQTQNSTFHHSTEGAQLLISATGVPYSSNRTRNNNENTGGPGSAPPQPRRPAPGCMPLMNTSEPVTAGLELSGARLGRNTSSK